MSRDNGVTIHQYKTWPEYFEAVLAGQKNFEYRRDDRPGPAPKVGDTLLLREWDNVKKRYTGRKLSRTVTYRLWIEDSDCFVAGFCPEQTIRSPR